MTTSIMISLLFAIELALVAVLVAFYFYRKAKRLASGGNDLAEEPPAAISLSYSQALRQQVAMTREFINTSTNVAHRALAERRLQYLEAELAAYLTDDRLPNWDILSPLLAGLFTIPSINASLEETQHVEMDQYDMTPASEPVDVWHVLSEKMLEFLVSASRQGELLNGFCQGLADTGELFVVFDQSSQTKQALSHALESVMASLGQPMAELDELLNHIESHQAIVGSCADAIVQQAGPEEVQTALAELVTLEQSITDIAVTLQIVDPAELARLTSPVTDMSAMPQETDTDLSDIEFMVMDSGDGDVEPTDSVERAYLSADTNLDSSLLPDADGPIDMTAIDDILAATHDDDLALDAVASAEVLADTSPTTDELMALQMMEMNLSDGVDEFKDMSNEELMALQMMEFSQASDDEPAAEPELSTDELMALQMMEMNGQDAAQQEGDAKS